MAYSYHDFENAARNSGLYNQFSAYDLALAQANPEVGMGLLSAKQAWNNATDDAGRSAANQQAEALRSNAYNTAGITSYTGGSWGNEYNPILNNSANDAIVLGNPTGSMVPQTTSAQNMAGTSFTPATAANASGTKWGAENTSAYPTFTPSATPQLDLSAYGNSAPVYQSQLQPQISAAGEQLGNYPAFQYDPYTDRYDAEIQAAKNEAFNRDPFNYDYATDPVYQAYAKQYRREGQRSMQDTLAQQAARTGGMMSSAAISAAQQANNYYNSQLSDKIPQLYADAYNRYLQDYSMSMDKLNSLMKLSDTDYSRYDTNRKFDFGIYQDRYDQMRNYFDALLTQDQNLFNQSEASRDQWNKDVNRAIDIWRSQVGDQQWSDEMAYKAAEDAWNAAFDVRKLGYDQEQAAIDRAYQEEQDRLNWEYKNRLADLQYSGGSGGGGGSRSSSGGTNTSPIDTSPIDDGVIDDETETTIPGLVAKAVTSNPTAFGGYDVKQPEDIPVYMNENSNEVMATYKDSEIQQLLESGLIVPIILTNGDVRYIYVGGVYGPSKQNAAKKATGATDTKARNRQDSLN